MTYEERVDRKNQIHKMYKKDLGITFDEIAKIFGISRQRVQQIYTHKPYEIKVIKPKKLYQKKTFRYFNKHESIRDIKIDCNKFSGRQRTREIVRIRDKHTCQDCGKLWSEGSRRFDIHHLNGLCGQKSKSYDKISDTSGLVTLCHKCHFNRPEHKCRTKEFSKNVSDGHRK